MISYTFVNGIFSNSSDVPRLVLGIQDNNGDFSIHLNENEIVLRIQKNTRIAQPIHLHFITKDITNHFYAPRIKLIAEENSQITIIEEYSAENAEQYVTKVATELHVEQYAKIQYYKIQNESFSATHDAYFSIQQKKESCVKTFFSDLGSMDAREHIQVKLAEVGAACDMLGFYSLSRDKQKLENLISVDHLAEHGTSAMLYKGILDKKSQATFNGKIFVDQKAKKIQSQQANHNLLLSKEAEVKTKPELEIYADDVKCAHGATVGQLDEDALFYLRARGIEKEQAFQLLTRAFLMDVVNQIEENAIRTYVQERTEYADV